MAQLDDELEALLTPLGVMVEQKGESLPISVEIIPHASYQITMVRLSKMKPSSAEKLWHGTTYLEVVAETFDTVGEREVDGLRIVPCTSEVERVLAKRGVPWCAYPDYALVALPYGEIIFLLLCLGHEHELAICRRKRREHRAARVLSERLRWVLWQGEATRFLPYKEGSLLCGWIDGYCAILAGGLLEWIRQSSPEAIVSLASQLMILAGEGKTIDHVVVQIGSWFLDSNGVSSQRTLLRYWQNQEGLVRPRLLAYDQQVVERAGIPLDQQLSHEIATCLMQVLGPFSFS